MFQILERWWLRFQEKRLRRRLAKARRTLVSDFCDHYQTFLQKSADNVCIFDRAVSDFPNAYSVGWSRVTMYIHPFIFHAEYDLFHRRMERSDCGVVLDRSKFNLEVIKDRFSSNPRPESRDADWFTFELGSDSPHWEVLPEFIGHIDMLVAQEKSDFYRERAKKDALKAEAVRQRFTCLLAETRIELPSRELLDCPQCGSHFLLPRSHGKLMYCTNCSKESVVVASGDEVSLEELQPLLV